MIGRMAALVLVAAGASGAASADDCAALSVPGAVAAVVTTRPDVTVVQAGLRVVFGADSGFLADGIVGPVTLSFLEQLCRSVPLAAGTEPVAGTVDLAREYAALSRLASGWPGRIVAPSFLAAAAGEGRFNRDLVRLAGLPEMSAVVLGAAAVGAACGAEPDPGGVPALEAGLAALYKADPDLGPRDPDPAAALARVCAAYPVAGGPETLAASVEQIGRVAQTVPGAAGILGSPAFAAWLAEQPAVRLSRLLGTAPAVVRLLTEFGSAASAAEAPAAPEALAETCPPPAGDVPTYLSLEPADMERLTARAGIGAALAPVAEQRFERQDDLVAAVDAALGLSPPDCGALLVEAAVTRHAGSGTVFSLDGEGVKRLALRPELSEVVAALEPLEELESPSRAELTAGLEGAIRASVGKAVVAEAGTAADAAAAAAEDVSPAPDTPVPGIPPAEDAEPAQSFAITDTSVTALQEEVTDQAFLDAITASPYRPVSSRALVRSDMLAAMRNVITDRSEALTQASLEEALPAVRARWRLDDAVVADLAADPVFAAVPPQALEAVGGLAGIAYPFPRLFDKALAGLQAPLADEARAAVLDVALKRVDEPYARRMIAPVAADCGCNVRRRENSLVYAFYPFWQYGAAAAAETARIDFDLVGRVAFDGLEIGSDAELRYAPQWSDAAATFIASAHRHKAKVDLGIRIDGWRAWDEDEVRSAAGYVVEEMRRVHPVETLVISEGLFGWLDPWLDRRPDGVTLLVAGYAGDPRTDGDPHNLVDLVRLIAAGLEGTGQTINLAFDVPLTGAADADLPLFQDLRGLVVNVADPDARLVRNLLVFLERPTSGAKKMLRARVEASFKGVERIEVLRSIIPVVPPGANSILGTQQADAGPVTTTDANSYGQFQDDILYFQDNFDGVGFWPAPAVGAVLPDGSPDRLGELVGALFYAWEPPMVPKRYQAPVREAVEGVCSFVCPNRLAMYLAAAVAGAASLLVTALSYYSGRTRNLVRRLLVVPILALVVLVLLMITATCDADSWTWSPMLIFGLVLLMAGSVAFNWYERRVDGPMP